MDPSTFRILEDDAPPVILPDRAILDRFGLRAYQRGSVESTIAGFQEPGINRQLNVLATGAGKTVIFSALASLNKMDGGKTLLLAHTDELIDQGIDKCKRVTGMRVAKEKAHSYASRFEQIVFGSIQSMAGDMRLSTWKKNHFNRIIVDESHRVLAKSYQKILTHFEEGGAKVIGFTATPDRGDKQTLLSYFQRVAYEYTLLDACRDGWLVGPVFHTIPLKIDLTGVKRKETSEGRDLDRMEVGKRIAPFLDQIAREIASRAGKGKILIFLPSVETAQLMSEAMVKAGVSSRWVCGDKNLCPDRTKIVAQHKANHFQALCNMALLTEGYDDDEIQYLIVLRPTEIRSLYAQMIGRGTRPHGSIVKALQMAANAYERVTIIKNSVKPRLIVFDFLWLHEKHNLVQRASLVAPSDKVAKEMGQPEGDLVAAVARAQVDLLKKLEDQVRKNANRDATTIDPLAMATELADVQLADYEPESANDRMSMTERQAEILKRNGIDLGKVKCRGHATALILRITDRYNKGLSNVRQIHFLKELGVDATQMTHEEARKRMDEATQAKQMVNFQLINGPEKQEDLVW